MSSAVRVPSSARQIFELLTGFCDSQGIQWESLPQNGSGHCVLAITFNGVTRKVTFASSPSDNFRGGKNALGYLKRTLRQIGWEPSQPEDEDEEDMGPDNIRTMKFDAQKPSTGPASEVTMLPLKVKGVAVPVQAQQPTDAQVLSYRDSIDLFLVEVMEAGGTLKDAVKALELVGYPLSLDAAKERHDRAAQMLAGGGKPKADAPVLTKIEREAIRIISALVEERMADKDAEIARLNARIDELTQKADKYDALKGLLGA
jgi:hypothetical protein